MKNFDAHNNYSMKLFNELIALSDYKLNITLIL